ncbi:MAG: hypothetical protein GF349_03345 [Candidatus Magasanikbacteria bacterium]|nr:hypothetical protein [Candidatus Magasanikbacteria bacterium]
MSRKTEDIEIQEPPIEELKKQRSCLKRTCFTGCGCFFIFIVIFLLLLRFAAGSGTEKLETVPDNYPLDIPIYDEENIESIIYTHGQGRGRIVEIAAFIPKLVLSPILLALDEYELVPISQEEREGAKGFTWENFVKLMNEPMADKRDQLEISWHELPASKKFIFEYYKNKLNKNDFSIKESKITEQIKKIGFSKKNLDGELIIEDNPDTEGTDLIILKIIFP